MADQVRSLPELITDFQDNVTGKIRARYSRDLACTVFGQRATVDPTVNNDSSDTAALGVKFSVGSAWTNTNLWRWFVCVDDRPGIAKWLQMTSAADLTALVAALHAYSDAAAAAAQAAAQSFATSADVTVLSSAETYSDAVGASVLALVPSVVVTTVTASSGGNKFHETWYTFGVGAGQVCQGNDSRLSDARTPLPHAASHNAGGSDALAIDSAAGVGSFRTLGSGGQQACGGTDSRLSDARAPTAHATSHQNGGSDEVASSSAGANLIPKAGAGGTLAIGWIPTGTTSITVCLGNDSRLSDARTPTAHATSHQPGGTDAMAVDAAAATGSLRTLGTGGSQATAGNDSRLSDARTPTTDSVGVTDAGPQVIATATPTAITFGTETWDVGGLHEGVTHPTRLTAARTGYYVVCGSFTFGANATGTRSAAIRKNGTTGYGGFSFPSVPAGAGPTLTCSALVNLTAGDYVELLATQTSGGNLNATGSFFYMALISV